MCIFVVGYFDDWICLCYYWNVHYFAAKYFWSCSSSSNPSGKSTGTGIEQLYRFILFQLRGSVISEPCRAEILELRRMLWLGTHLSCTGPFCRCEDYETILEDQDPAKDRCGREYRYDPANAHPFLTPSGRVVAAYISSVVGSRNADWEAFARRVVVNLGPDRSAYLAKKIEYHSKSLLP